MRSRHPHQQKDEALTYILDEVARAGHVSYKIAERLKLQ